MGWLRALCPSPPLTPARPLHARTPRAPLPHPPQHTTWKLGAPLVSMLYGLRLVASIGEQRAALGYTVIQSGVQIAGATLAVASVTVYAGWQYWRSRRAAAAGASAASLASRSSGGGGK